MHELLDLAFDAPDQALGRARQVIAETSDPRARSYAYQCLGIIDREAGRHDAAVASLRTALRLARSLEDDERVRDVRASYGGALLFAGRVRQGLAQLELAAAGASGPVASRVRTRLGFALLLLGRHVESATVLRAALEPGPDRDPIWEARTRNGLGYAELGVGHLAVAEAEIAAAQDLFREQGATIEMLEALENRGEVAIARGSLSAALRLFAEATAGYRDAGVATRFELVCAQASAFLAAGLAVEAVELLGAVPEDALPELRRADLYLNRADARLAASEAETALADARRAHELYRRQGRDWFAQLARLTEVRARAVAGPRSGLARYARETASALQQLRSDHAAIALTIAGRLAEGDARIELWRQAAAHRSRANGLVRASAFLAGALACEELHDRGGLLRACAAGLDAIDEHRRLMGSSELRALATTHGRELTEIALRHAAHDPRTLLRWSERTRATALAQPPATSDAATIPASLAALRDNGRRLAEARQAGEPTEDLEKERLRLERAVRTEAHTVSADTDPQRPASVEEIVSGVGDGCLVELVDVDGVLHVLVVHNGRVRRRVAGAVADAESLLGPAGMLLRRASRGRPADTADLGRRLQEAVLGDATRLLPDGPVTLAPTARLHGLAWSLLPTLDDRPFSVVPSAGQWLRATNATRPRKRRTVLVAGPDLESGGAEVPILAARHPDAVLLDRQDATLAAVLDQLDGADLAHLATHGRFRADSPLFSALDLADGPLTVHDLERLRRAPYRVVLSACESGVLAPVGAQELLGLAAALFSIGSAGLVCSVAEVNDAATADLMVALHDGLARGKDPAAALHDVRQGVAGDSVAAGTAAAFVALGV